MKKTFKYRLKPTKSQRTRLNKILEQCRWLYNEILATRKNAWEQEQRSISFYNTMNMLPQLKKDRPELSVAHSQVLQNVCVRVGSAFQGFFRRVKKGQNPGYPRFRGYGRYNSFTYPQSGFKLLDNKVYISKVGNVRIKLHRPIEGTIKTLTIRRDLLGNWYACFSCEFKPVQLPRIKKTVGIDVGLKSFATFSNSEKVDNPRFLRKDEKKLAKAQRGFSKDKSKKTKRAVQHIHQRIANRRKDFTHKISRRLVNTFQVIVFEDLNIQDMQSDNWNSLNKSIADAAWRQLIQFTQYKAEWAGRECVLVDSRNTTQMCSRCGRIVHKDLSTRVHDCPRCGLKIDRDMNAAINILRLGLESLDKCPGSRCL